MSTGAPLPPGIRYGVILSAAKHLSETSNG